jgi:hypothetical protein
MRWHNQQGLKGIDTEEDNSAIDIGSVVHAAIERHMRGAGRPARRSKPSWSGTNSAK